MKYLLNLLASFLMLFSLSAVANTPEWIVQTTKGKVPLSQAVTISKLVYLYSHKYEVNPDTVFRIIKVESNFNLKAHSRENAKGIMQLMPQYHRKELKGRNIYNLEANLDVGIKAYAYFLKLYNGDENKALRGYNGSTHSNVYPRMISKVKLPVYTVAYFPDPIIYTQEPLQAIMSNTQEHPPLLGIRILVDNGDYFISEKTTTSKGGYQQRYLSKSPEDVLDRLANMLGLTITSVKKET